MPGFLAFLPLMMAAAKTVGGLLTKQVDPHRLRPEVPTEAREAVMSARRQAGVTVAPGYSTHLESLRKMSQDAIANARKNIKDPNQLQQTISMISQTMRKGAGDLQGMNERYRSEAMRNLQSQLQNLSAHRVRVQEKLDQQYMEQRAAQRNLFGSAFQDVNVFSNQLTMEKSMSDFMKNLTGLFGGGSGIISEKSGSGIGKTVSGAGKVF